MIVLDPSVLIAFADPANASHQDAKRIMTTTEALAVTALTGAEILVSPSREQQFEWRDLFHALAVEVVPITENDMRTIANMRRTSDLKMPDALVLWAAKERKAGVATFDEQLRSRAEELGLRTV